MLLLHNCSAFKDLNMSSVFENSRPEFILDAILLIVGVRVVVLTGENNGKFD